MRIVIDGNACPQTARKTCLDISEKNYIPFVIVMEKPFSADEGDPESMPELRMIAPGEHDYKMSAMVYPDDIVITHDYNLAAALYERVLAVIHPDGYIYNQSNMDELLYYRYMSFVTRNPGKDKEPKIRRRTQENDDLFRQILEDLVSPVEVKSPEKTEE